MFAKKIENVFIYKKKINTWIINIKKVKFSWDEKYIEKNIYIQLYYAVLQQIFAIYHYLTAVNHEFIYINNYLSELALACIYIIENIVNISFHDIIYLDIKFILCLQTSVGDIFHTFF